MHANIIRGLKRFIYCKMNKEAGRPQPFPLHVVQLNHSVSGLKAPNWQAILGNSFILCCWYIVQDSEHDKGQLWTSDRELHRLIPRWVESVVLNNSCLGSTAVSSNAMNFDLTCSSNKYHKCRYVSGCM